MCIAYIYIYIYIYTRTLICDLLHEMIKLKTNIYTFSLPEIHVTHTQYTLHIHNTHTRSTNVCRYHNFANIKRNCRDVVHSCSKYYSCRNKTLKIP